MKSHASMNRIYRLVWNQLTNAWVAVAETAKGRGKGSARKLIAAALSLSAVAAMAAPDGGQVVAGSGTISQSGSTTTVAQTSQNLSLTWKTFNVAAQETVNFVQPSASAIAVNRIYDTNASQILGHLNANGQVYLINPNGILFGQGAQVNVGALVASTLNLSDASLSSNTRSFGGTGTGSVINQGTINAANGGYVALLGNTVINQGTISAPSGTVALGAGSAATLTFSGNSLMSLQIDQSTLNNLADNGGLLRADGGTVLMSAGAKDALLASVVNNTGVIEARTAQNVEGTIILLGGMTAGTVKVGGTLDASALSGGNGGFIETSAAQVQVADGTKVSTLAASGKTGTWLIDPTDFTISSGSGAQTTSGMGASTLSNNLGTTSVILSTDNSTGTDSGDINVNAAVSWSANTTLTLNAYNNININAPITATGATAGLVMNYGGHDGTAGGSAFSGTDYNVKAPITLSGSGASLAINGQSYTLIHDMAGLAAINAGLDGKYALAENLDANGTSYTSALVGTSATPFTGTFAGLGHTLSKLTITAGSNDNVGLFGVADAYSTIRDIGLVGASVSGRNYVGALVGNNLGTVSNSYVTGSVSGSNFVGGLAGANDGSVSNSYATSSVSVGVDGLSVTVDNNIGFVGGLVGSNSGSINYSYATGDVSETGILNGNNNFSYIGGLVGGNGGNINYSYATGKVTLGGSLNGDNNVVGVGGLVGGNDGTIYNSYATGRVTAGGIVTGVGNNSFVGGLVGGNRGYVSSSYWDSGSTNMAIAIGANLTDSATGLVTDATGGAAYTHNSYADLGTWSETAPGTGVWVANDGSANRWVMIEGSTRPFLYSEYSTSIHNAHQLQLMAVDLGANYTLANNIDATETSGSNASGMWTVVGFSPVGNSSFNFGGSLDGQSHDINHLRINLPNSDNVGLFGQTSGASLSRLSLTDVLVSGASYVGALVGYSAGGTIDGVSVGGRVTGHGNGGDDRAVGGLAGYSSASISNSQSSATVQGFNDPMSESAYRYVGGLVGWSDGSITGSSASGDVTGPYDVAGLVGYNTGAISYSSASGTVHSDNGAGGLVSDSLSGSSISNSFATGAVSGYSGVGGLVGRLESGATVSSVYATGHVSGGYAVGGLAGYNLGSISNAYATGAVTLISGGSNAGGLVGYNSGGSGASDGVIIDAYATGNVTGGSGTNYLGGLVGDNDYLAKISHTYATGSVSGTGSVGKLVGSNNYGDVKTSFWLTETGTSGIGDLTNGTVDSLTRGLSSSEATTASTYQGVGWDVATTGGTASVWRIYEGDTKPLLRSFLTGLSATAESGTKVYDGGTSTTLGVAGYSTIPDSNLLGTAFVTVTTGSKNVGTQTSTVRGLFSNQQGYDITTVDGTMVISKANLAVSGLAASSKTYDAGTVATLTGTAAVTALGTDSVTLGGTASGNFANKTVGTTKAVTVTGNTLSGTDAGNYNLVQQTGLTADISKADLAVTGLAASSKTYDTTAIATLTGTATVTALTGDSVTLGGTASGSFANKTVGTTKAVTVTGNTLSGTDAGNYNLLQQTGLQANISKADLAVTGLAASSKTYDAGTVATLTGTAAVTALSGDSITLGGTASGSFANKTVGTGKAVTVAGNTLSGMDAGNYNLVQQTGLTANISKADLAVTGLAASNKTYDAGTVATLTGIAAVTALGSDSITLGGTASGSFANKTVGTGKAVTVAGNTLSGTDAGNYNLVQQTGITANISKADLAVTGLAASSKTYDAGTVATLTGTAAVTALGSDSVTLGGTASGTFINKTVGTTKAVTVTGNTLSGTDAGNYNLVQQTGLTANISKADLAVTGLSASNKTYDAGTVATLTGTAAVTALGSDSITLGGTASGSFANKTVGTGKAVTVAGNTLSGTDAGNYNLVQQTGLTADISKATLSYAATPTSLTAGQAPTGLAGAVTGFLADDTQANSSIGNLVWTTPVTTTSKAGQYAINGAGLSSVNYVYVQAAANATALTLKPDATPKLEPVRNSDSQLASNNFSCSLGVPGMERCVSPVSGGRVDRSNANPTVNVAMTNSSQEAALKIVNGGVKLPSNMVNINE